MSEDERFEEVKEKVVRENLLWSEDQRKYTHNFQQLARKQWDRLRETVRRRDFDAWLNDVAQRLGRSPDTVRLLGPTETYALQDANPEASFLWHLGNLPGFEREVPADQAAEVERLLDKIAARLTNTPVYLLCGADVLWLHGEPERWEVWGNGSGYFGAIEATSAEVLANAPAWLDRHDGVMIRMVSATDKFESLTLSWMGDQRGTFYLIQLVGPQWGRLLADEQSDWTYEEWLRETIRLRTQRGAGGK